MIKRYKKVRLFLIIFTIAAIAVIWIYFSSSDEPIDDSFPDLSPVLVYNKAFAQRFGLDQNKAMDLDPGIYAIALTFKKNPRYSVAASDDYPTELKNIFNKLDKWDWLKISTSQFDSKDELNDYTLLPIFLGKSSMNVSYVCEINFYFDEHHSKVKDIKLSPHQIWFAGIVYDNMEPLYPIFRGINHNNKNKIHEPGLIKTIPQFKYPYDDLLHFYAAYIDNTPPAWAIEKSGKSPSNEIYVSGDYRSNFKDFLPGILFLSFKISCPGIIDASNKHGSWFWIQTTHSSYDMRDTKKFTSQDFHPFHLPAEIVRSKNVKKATEAITLQAPHPIF